MRFGETYLQDVSFPGRIGFYLHGFPFVSSWLRHRYFMHAIKGLYFSEVLDAGCGSGDFVFYLARKYPHARISGLDCDKDIIMRNVRFAEKNGIKNVSFMAQNVHEFSCNRRFDLIYSIESLQYVGNNERVIHNFFAALKQGGYLYIHMLGPDWNGPVLFGRRHFRNFYSEVKKFRGKRYTPVELSCILQRIGFEPLIVKRTFGPFGRLAWEIDNALMSVRPGFVRSLFILPLKLVCLLDMSFSGMSGWGCLVLARKKNE